MKPTFYSLALVLSFAIFNVWQYYILDKQDSDIKLLQQESIVFEDRLSALESIAFDINGETKLMIHENGGTSIGGDNTPPEDGLHVLGDINLLGNIEKEGVLQISSEHAISLGVGSNNLTIDSTGIYIDGTVLNINGSASVNINSTFTTVSGASILDLNGGTVFIN